MLSFQDLSQTPLSLSLFAALFLCTGFSENGKGPEDGCGETGVLGTLSFCFRAGILGVSLQASLALGSG